MTADKPARLPVFTTTFLKNARFLTLLVLPVTAAVLTVNLLFPHHAAGRKTAEKAKPAVLVISSFSTGEPMATQAELADPGWHRELIDRYTGENPQALRKDTPLSKALTGAYSRLSRSGTAALSDAGYYALGYYLLNINEPDAALTNLQKVKNRRMKFLNNSLGYAWMSKKEYKKAEGFFREEIRLGGFMRAYENLARTYYQTRDYPKLRALVANPESRAEISPFYSRITALTEGRIGAYFSLYLTEYRSLVGLEGLIGALFILIIWLVYIRNLDLFEPEGIVPLLLTLFLGIICALGCLLLYDFWDFALNFRMTGEWKTDLAYSILGIGVIEELVKLIPVVIILTMTRQINESVDFVVYAGVSALGFAFMENLHYLSSDGVSMVYARSLSAVVLHISLTTLAAYGFASARFFRKNNAFFSVLVTFSAAAILHGLYDFVLISPAFKEFSVISLFILLFSAGKYKQIIANTVSTSEYFDSTKLGRYAGLLGVLVYGLTWVYLVQYVLIGWRSGAAEANKNLLTNAGLYTALLFIISWTLGVVRIQQGRWKGLILGWWYSRG